jgi:hypothetical protein
MKKFEPLAFSAKQCRKEVSELQKWLQKHQDLKEAQHIRPFFEKRRHLSAFLASFQPNMIRFNRIAFQYPLFGDFTCDIAVGDSTKNAYCFIELEDAGPKSLFVQQAKKSTREWSPRFEHGYSQIIDWFYKLEDMKKSDAFAAQFGARSIDYLGMLLVGRDQYLQQGEKERLQWRCDNVIVASRKVHCVTFDGLLEDLLGQLETFPLTSETGG